MSSKRRDKRGRILKDNEYQRKDGLYEFKYEDLDGNRKSVYSWKLTETDNLPAGKRDDTSLRQKEKEIYEKLNEGIIVCPQKAVLNDLFAMHMKIRQFSISTEENYRYMWKRFMENSIGRRNVTTLKKSDVLCFYAEQKKNGLADGTIQMLHKLIHPSLQIAVEDNMIRSNPSDGCCKDYAGKESNRYALTPEETEALLAYVGKLHTRQRYELLFRVMLGTSCRIAEIMGLTWENIDMKNRIVTIDHSILYRKKDGKTQFYAKTPKTANGIRKIPMTEDVYTCFRELQKERFLHQSSVAIDGYTNFVFTSMKGKPLYPANVNKALYRIVKNYNKQAGDTLPKISNHIFRHTGCTRMAEAEMDMKSMQYIMGHSSAKTVLKVYDHLSMERVEKQMKKLDFKRSLTG